MKNHIYFILLIAIINGNLYSQRIPGRGVDMPALSEIFGMVIDSISLTPLEYASVSLIHAQSDEIISGRLTDKNGYFSITDISFGKYHIAVEFIGYSRKVIRDIAVFPQGGAGTKQNLGTIALKVSPVNLAEVEVIGEESQFIQTIDKQVFNVGKNLASSGGTGADVLRKIPTVDVDIDGAVTIAGDANVTVLIDGKKSGLSGSQRRGEVNNIAASMIEKVEVITNPSAKYDPDGVGGIINIILKRGSFEGYNGTVSMLAGEYEKINLNGNVNYRNGYWNIFSNLNLNTGNFFGNGLREFQYIYTANTDSLFQTTERLNTPKNASIRIGGDVYPSKTSTLGYTFTYSANDDRSEEGINNVVNTINDGNNIDIQIFETEDGTHFDHSLSYNNDFDSKGKKLKAEIKFEQENESKIQTGKLSAVQDYTAVNDDTKNDEDNKSFMGSLDFENTFNEKFSVETGGKADIHSYGSTLNYLLQPYSNQYDENIFAAYIIGAYNLNHRFSLKAGARLESVKTQAVLKKEDAEAALDSTNIITEIFDLALEQSPYENPYTSIYPSVFLLYKLSEKQNIQFGFSKKVNRPMRRTLSPFPQNTNDITRIRTGNPYLDPEYSDVVEIKYWNNYGLINLNTGLSYKLTRDAIMWWDRDYIEFDSTSYEILTADNSNNSINIGGDLTLLYRPMPLINLMISGWMWNAKTYGNGESDLNGTSQGYFLRSQLTAGTPGIVRIELSIGGRGKMKMNTGTMPATLSTDLGIQKSFLNNKLSVTLKVNDVFNSRKFRINTENTITNPVTNEVFTQLMYAERQREQRFVALSLEYSFGKQQKKKWDRNQYENGGGGIDMDY